MQTYNILQRKTMNVCVKKEVGMPSALPLCKPAGNALLVGAELRAYGIKQVNRTVDDVSHLFRAVVTLGLNHIADPAVQAHFRRLQGLGCSFFSSYFVLSMNKNAGQYGMSGTHYKCVISLSCYSFTSSNLKQANTNLSSSNSGLASLFSEI